MRRLHEAPLQPTQTQHKRVKAQQGVAISGVKNESRGHAGNGVGEVDLPCVGYAVCMKPQEYAESFP